MKLTRYLEPKCIKLGNKILYSPHLNKTIWEEDFYPPEYFDVDDWVLIGDSEEKKTLSDNIKRKGGLMMMRNLKKNILILLMKNLVKIKSVLFGDEKE